MCFCDLAWQEGQSLCRQPAARDIHFFQLVENRGCYHYPRFKNSIREETHRGYPISWSICCCWKPAALSCVQEKTLLPPWLFWKNPSNDVSEKLGGGSMEPQQCDCLWPSSSRSSDALSTLYSWKVQPYGLAALRNCSGCSKSPKPCAPNAHNLQ